LPAGNNSSINTVYTLFVQNNSFSIFRLLNAIGRFNNFIDIQEKHGITSFKNHSNGIIQVTDKNTDIET
jgi:hypothetical protein